MMPTDYEGAERRDRQRREQPLPIPTWIDGFTNGASQMIETALKIGKAIVVLLGTLVVMGVGGGVWVKTMANTSARHDDEIGLTTEAVTEISRTLAAVVAEQKAMRRDVEHLRKGEQ